MPRFLKLYIKLKIVVDSNFEIGEIVSQLFTCFNMCLLKPSELNTKMIFTNGHVNCNSWSKIDLLKARF